MASLARSTPHPLDINTRPQPHPTNGQHHHSTSHPTTHPTPRAHLSPSPVSCTSSSRSDTRLLWSPGTLRTCDTAQHTHTHTFDDAASGVVVGCWLLMCAVPLLPTYHLTPQPLLLPCSQLELPPPLLLLHCQVAHASVCLPMCVLLTSSPNLMLSATVRWLNSA